MAPERPRDFGLTLLCAHFCMIASQCPDGLLPETSDNVQLNKRDRGSVDTFQHPQIHFCGNHSESCLL